MVEELRGANVVADIGDFRRQNLAPDVGVSKGGKCCPRTCLGSGNGKKGKNKSKEDKTTRKNLKTTKSNNKKKQHYSKTTNWMRQVIEFLFIFYK